MVVNRSTLQLGLSSTAVVLPAALARPLLTAPPYDNQAAPPKSQPPAHSTPPDSSAYIPQLHVASSKLAEAACRGVAMGRVEGLDRRADALRNWIEQGVRQRGYVRGTGSKGWLHAF